MSDPILPPEDNSHPSDSGELNTGDNHSTEPVPVGGGSSIFDDSEIDPQTDSDSRTLTADADPASRPSSSVFDSDVRLPPDAAPSIDQQLIEDAVSAGAPTAAEQQISSEEPDEQFATLFGSRAVTPPAIPPPGALPEFSSPKSAEFSVFDDDHAAATEALATETMTTADPSAIEDDHPSDGGVILTDPAPTGTVDAVEPTGGSSIFDSEPDSSSAPPAESESSDKPSFPSLETEDEPGPSAFAFGDPSDSAGGPMSFDDSPGSTSTKPSESRRRSSNDSLPVMGMLLAVLMGAVTIFGGLAIYNMMSGDESDTETRRESSETPNRFENMSPNDSVGSDWND